MNTPKKIKNYLKNMKYQLSLVYSKEDVRAIMDIIQEHVNIFLEQNPSASEENIKQCICEIGDFLQVGIENIDFHTLMQKIEELIGQKRKVYIIAIFRLCGINAQKLTRGQAFRFTLRVNFYPIIFNCSDSDIPPDKCPYHTSP